MPLSAKAQAERRANLKKFEEPKKPGRRVRCDNCDTRFHKSRKDQRFCCANCRKEFFANGGSAFGPLKVRLEKLVRSITHRIWKTEHEWTVKQLEELRTANETAAAHKPTPEAKKL